jgi:hypothetical protein
MSADRGIAGPGGGGGGGGSSGGPDGTSSAAQLRQKARDGSFGVPQFGHVMLPGGGVTTVTSSGAGGVGVGVGVGVVCWSPSADSPVHSRKLPQEPQNPAPRSFSNPHFRQTITMRPRPRSSTAPAQTLPPRAEVYRRSTLAAVAAIATLAPAQLQVEPGRDAAVVVKVRNSGSIVDRLDVTVVGPMAQYALAEPAGLSLFPGQEGEVRVTFRPPRATYPRAGTYPFAVRVVPAAEPTGATVEEGRQTIQPFVEPSAEVVPMTSRGSRGSRHEVIVENRGNAPLAAAVEASDPDRLLSFSVSPPQIAVEPGGRASAAIHVRPSDTFLTGAKRTFPFVVEVEVAGREAPLIVRPTYVQGPQLPAWVLPAAGIAVLGIAAILVLPRVLSPEVGPVADASASPTASPSASPSESASAEVSESPSASPSESPSDGGGSPTPEVTPSPGPFELIVEGEEVVLGGALELKCPPEPLNSVCRLEALQTVDAIRNQFGAQYDGAGIVSTTNTRPSTGIPTVPITLARDVPFDWLAQGGTVTDQSSRAVIDLAPLVATPPGFAYVVVDSTTGPRRFVVSDGLARQLLSLLYEENPAMVDPAPSRTVPPFGEILVQDNISWNFLVSPPPGG